MFNTNEMNIPPHITIVRMGEDIFLDMNKLYPNDIQESSREIECKMLKSPIATPVKRAKVK